MSHNIHRSRRGVTTIMVIAFMGIFLMLLGTLTSFAMQESRYGRALYAREQAFNVAEAGLEYYRWFLAHNPNNLTNGTGGAGPYSYTVTDSEAGTPLGVASISVTGNMQCGIVQSIDITSTGRSNLDTGFPRTLVAHYMQPSVAGYSYLLNSNVLAGASRNISGPYFSNNGIRMDGTNNSDVLSAVATWLCDPGFGCAFPSETKNGVFGAGSGSALWKYPVSTIDFSKITADLSKLKGYAQINGGLYFAPAAGTKPQRGYHLIFRNNGTVDVYRVTSTTAVPGKSPIAGSAPDGDTKGTWSTENNIIAMEVLVGNYTIPLACSVIYIEDRVWVEGIVSRKVTVASADFVEPSHITSAFLPNNITYTTYDGSVGLTVITVGDVLITLQSPDFMEIHGIFIAQTGHYGRHFYTNASGYCTGSGSFSGNGCKTGATWSANTVQSQLTTVGTVVSNQRTGTQWGSASGYQTRIDSYDQLQATNPPPFTPAASLNYQFVLWREQ